MAIACVLTTTGNIASAALAIVNPSFEGVALSDGQFAPGTAPSWGHFSPTFTGNGILNPAVGSVLQPTDGDNVAVVSGNLPAAAFGTGVHWYDMGGPEPGSYTISADFALEADAIGGFEFWIQAFDVLGGPLGWDNAVDFTASHGNTYRDFSYANAPGGGLKTDAWTTVSLSFDVDPTDLFLTAGDQNLRLVITNQGTNSTAGANGMLVDNVRISFTPAAAVPEPSTMILVGAGVIGLGIARWSRQK